MIIAPRQDWEDKEEEKEEQQEEEEEEEGWMKEEMKTSKRFRSCWRKVISHMAKTMCVLFRYLSQSHRPCPLTNLN